MSATSVQLSQHRPGQSGGTWQAAEPWRAGRRRMAGKDRCVS
jgi:hypothetical protein